MENDTSPPTKESANPTKATHLFLLSGQSNMARLDPEVSFTPTVKEAFPHDDIIVTKVALGGRPIARWVPRGVLYTRLLEQARKDLGGKEPTTITFVWMQGERDHQQDETTQAYRANLEALYRQLQEDFKRTDINWVIGRLSDARLDTPNWVKIREIQVAVADKNPRAAWIDTDDLNGPKDDVHCPPEGYEEMGRRFAQKAIALIQKGKPRDK